MGEYLSCLIFAGCGHWWGLAIPSHESIYLFGAGSRVQHVLHMYIPEILSPFFADILSVFDHQLQEVIYIILVVLIAMQHQLVEVF